VIGQAARDFRCEARVERVDRLVAIPLAGAVGAGRRPREAFAQLTETRAQVDEQRPVAVRGDRRRIARAHRVADDDDRIRKALDRPQRWLHAPAEGARRVVERKVGRGHVVARGAQGLGHSVPARRVVPCAVDEAEGRHAISWA
jgi:hypothetical protein